MLPDQPGLGPENDRQAVLDDDQLVSVVDAPAELADRIRHTAAKLADVAERIGSGPRDEQTLGLVEQAQQLLEQLQSACEQERVLAVVNADPWPGSAA